MPATASLFIALLTAVQQQQWTPLHSEGVTLSLGTDPGVHAEALRMDYDFKSQAGYVLAQREFRQKLPSNYAFEFWLKADSPANDFEFKLMDPTGQSVWWVKKFAYRWPREWTRVVIRKSQIQYAWGPLRNGLTETGSLQFGVAANAGGKGSVWISDFKFIQLPETKPFRPDFVAIASSGEASGLQRGKPWKASKKGVATLDINLGESREVGGAVIDGLPSPCDVDFITSADGAHWDRIQSQRGIWGGRAILPTPELETSNFRLVINGGSQLARASKVRLLPWTFSQSPQAILEGIASISAVGDYPKHLLKKQNFWTVSGGLNSNEESLISESGQVELFRGGPSLEPFLRVGGKLRSWAQASSITSLEQGSLPLPKVLWPGDISLSTQTFAAEDGTDAQVIRYTLTNSSKKAATPELLVALRPIQVNPSWQALNLSPLMAPIENLVMGPSRAEFDGHTLLLTTRATAQGATTILRGDLRPSLAGGSLPKSIASADPSGGCTGLWKFSVPLKAGQSKAISVIYLRKPDATGAWTSERVSASRVAAVKVWQDKLGPTIADISGNDSIWPHVVRANLGYILVNKDGPATHPGSRTYQRSWIRDGSLSCAAMLQMGLFKEVKDYIEWFAPYVREDGWVPCVVDHRGPDPLAEHDSHGQFLYLLAEYLRTTGDIETIRKFMPIAKRVANKIIELRNERKVAPYSDPNSPEHGFYGLLPQSASHEGYMDNHRHSYWDDFFGIKGLRDASYLAQQCGDFVTSSRIMDEAVDFEKCFRDSISWTMAHHKINWISGCVELGDFDGTSTAIGVYPCGAQSYLEPYTVQSTFNKYASWFRQRAANTIDWRDYTPYEVRVMSAMALLGRKADAQFMLNWFRRDLRPSGWLHWAEVGYKDPVPGRWIGDMPHTWVGAEFIKAFRNMLIFESATEPGHLVIGAGLNEGWLARGISVRPLPTHYGKLGYRAVSKGNLTTFSFTGSVNPGTKLEILNPRSASPHVVSIDGVNHQLEGGKVILSSIPKRLEFIYD